MTSSGTPAHEDLLAEALYALDRSKDRDGVLTSAIAAAERMNGCVGAVLLSVQRPDSQFYAPGDASPRAVTWHPAPPSTVELELGHTIAIDSSADVRVIGESFERSVQTTLVAALNGASGWDAIGFIWGRPIAFDAATVAFYRSLASAISLALQVRLTAQEASRGQDGFRRNIDELQHRLRSVLSFVRSIVRRTLLSAESPEEFAVHLEARISAVSRIYATLSIGAKGGGVELEDLLRTELQAGVAREEQLDIEGPSVRLLARAAETLALVFHELATNAVKFGALSVAHGRIEAHWRIETGGQGQRLHFSWIESGVHVDTSAQRRRGFGRELIEKSLPYELDAHTAFEVAADGVRCTLSIPVSDQVMIVAALTQSAGTEPGSGDAGSPVAGPVDLTGIRVLVVEDEYFIANEICAALRLCGANVLGPAPDNERALELVGTTAVDCAVLDINLHGQRDFALAEEFRRRGVPTIFATGYDETIVPGSLAMTKRLEKPVDLRTLLRSVKSAVRGG